MCIIAFKPKGVSLPPDFENRVRACMQSNSDGSGIAFKRNGINLVNIQKGFFKIEDALRAIRTIRIEKNDEFMFHARISTGGNINKENCHPYFVHNTFNIITSGSINILPAIAHNGIIGKYDVPDSSFCDTIHFIHKIISKPQYLEIFNTFPEKFEELFKDIWGWSKFVAIYPNRDAYVFNRKTFNEKDGILYSNYSHQCTMPKHLSGWARLIGSKTINKEEKTQNDLTMQRKYGKFHVHENGKMTAVFNNLILSQMGLKEKEICVNKRRTRPKFELKPNCSLKVLFDSYAQRTFLKIRIDNVITKEELLRQDYRILKVYKTGIKIIGEKTRKEFWINPIELVYNYQVQLKHELELQK